MGRSQETFNKKENEKKRIKKRQDKEQKKEDRKANSNKGKGMDDMIAYIDENGVISSTPPDASKKRSIKIDDIQIGVAKQKPLEPHELIRTGTVTFFNDSKGYGFIKDSVNQTSVFIHINQLSEPIKENDKVTFEVEKGPKGPNAVRVKKV
jgi:cold shock CspA family protein